MNAPQPPAAGTFLLLRKEGALWGVPGAAVTAVATEGGGFRVMLASGALAADDVLGVVDGLVVTSSRAAGRWWPAGVVGAAVHAGLPLAVVDAARPPAALAAPGEPGGTDSATSYRGEVH